MFNIQPTCTPNLQSSETDVTLFLISAAYTCNMNKLLQNILKPHKNIILRGYSMLYFCNSIGTILTATLQP